MAPRIIKSVYKVSYTSPHSGKKKKRTKKRKENLKKGKEKESGSRRWFHKPHPSPGKTK